MESHVIPGLIYKMHIAKMNNADTFSIWGTGKPKREFMHVDDLAESIYFLIENKVESSLINIGTGEEVTIKELAEKIKKL